MTIPQTAPYGAWRSPISTEMVTEAGIRLGEIKTDGADVYWLEGRPAEGGRNVIVRLGDDNEPVDVTPKGYNVRNRVHEYGGAAYGVKDGVVYFSNFSDQRIYRHRSGEQPEPVTPEPAIPAGDRFADGRLTSDGKYLVCVRERHFEGREAANEVVAVRADNGEQTVLASGHDFYSFPRLSPDGTRLAYTAWDHPNMPWDEAELWVASFDGSDGSSGGAVRVAGGNGESIFQPEWSPDGTLHFVSDRTGWWNLYALVDEVAQPLFPGEAESGEPQWVFGMATYAFLAGGGIALLVGGKAGRRLVIIDRDRQAREIELPYTSIGGLVAAGTGVLALAASHTGPAAIVRVDTGTGTAEVIRKSSDVEIDAEMISRPQSIKFPTGDGEEAHAYYYPPTNPEFEEPASESPPLIVLSHGGPTSAASSSLSLEIQFWTSRGFAVTDVNYRGSTGYGRAYRDALKGRWGVVDTEDCINAARYLVGQGLADESRAIIKGGSAGGYTTLCALVFRDYFAAGASYFGVADAETLATDTHKFESRYLDGLIGPYPEARDLYRQRSPIDYVDQLSCPVIIFQGLEDEIVPPSQAEAMVAALKAKGVPYAYLPFEGEQHGFRIAANIRRTLEAELYFYGKIFGFQPADEVEPIVIEGLPA